MKYLTIMPRHSPPGDTALARSIRVHMITAAAIVAALVVVGGGWTATTEISGAVIAPGSIVVASEVKHVQHREGGIVGAILVDDGDEVAAGDLLVRLDDSSVRTKQSIIVNQLAELKLRQARLVAEREGKDQIAFPARPDDKDPRDLAEIELRQALLLRARQSSLEKRKQQLDEQISQFEEQISGMEAQRKAKEDELGLLEEELAGVGKLYEKQLVTLNRLSSLKRDRTGLEGERGELISRIAGLKEAISERRLQIIQIDEDSRADVLQDLEDTGSQIAELALQKIAADDDLDRLQIRAPCAGFVHELAVHTIGGVIHPGDTIMKIVPEDDQLVIEAAVSPADIDQVYSDQSAMIRFPGLDQRTTPRLDARVERIAADLTVDEASRTQFYNVRLTIPKEQLAKLDGQRLVPGMPVEAFIATGDRTVLAYLTKPITDQIAHALKEG
jgi:membrane fusion protein, type I secretion system